MHLGGGAKNNVQTLKWATFDKARRVAKTRNVSGARCCGASSSQLATWIVKMPTSCPALCLFSTVMSLLQRPCDCTYKFAFDEGFRRADIKIMANCLPCVPCLPAWCQIPDALVRFEMVQADGVADGSHWYRNTSTCGGPMQRDYELKEVFTHDGSPGRFHSVYVEHAPQTYLMTR